MRESGEMLRRSRGYVPDALALPPALKCSACAVSRRGSENTFCPVRGEQAVLSQHLGDLSDDGIQMQWREALRLMQNIYDFTRNTLCMTRIRLCSSQWAREMNLPTQTVLHHHAHAAACLAEHLWPLDGGDVIALTLDGIGMGRTALYGGECLRVNYRECQHRAACPRWRSGRFGCEAAVAKPAGAVPALCAGVAELPETASVQQQNWSVLARAIERGINAPLASSCGRLFDAVAAALCAPATLSYEGEAACALEAMAASCHGVTHPVTMPLVDNQLDPPLSGSSG